LGPDTGARTAAAGTTAKRAESFNNLITNVRSINPSGEQADTLSP
jgi:hypothetical protein